MARGDPPGRKSTFTMERAEAVCRGMAAGKLSTEVVQEMGLPRGTVAEWRGDHPEFRKMYIDAFLNRGMGMAEEAIAELKAVPKGSDMAAVTLARAKSDLFKFFASRIVPWLAEQHVHQLTGEARVVIYLPDKRGDSRGQLLEGTATDVSTDET
jgi:hypothetical protein